MEFLYFLILLLTVIVLTYNRVPLLLYMAIMVGLTLTWTELRHIFYVPSWFRFSHGIFAVILIGFCITPSRRLLISDRLYGLFRKALPKISATEQEALDAIGIYEAYLRKYPDSEANDKILYQLSRAYAFESENEKSMRAMDRIVAEYPDSRYMDEVQFRRGEYLFVDQQHEAAELAYGDVVNRFPQSIYFEKSLYKYGWSQFKQGHFEDSLAS